MIEINKWSITLGIIGLTTSIASIIRWFFLYPDTSQFIIGTVIGVLIIASAYLYNWMKLKDLKLEEIEKRLDSHIYPPRE